MQQIVNGVGAGTLQGVTWLRSRRSAVEGNCIELAELPGGEVAVRNSRDPEGPALIYTRAEFTAFLAGAQDGEFDALAG
ncbi:DUF397 domain-containing protein [Streptomyces turgidiscabies]|uniref:Transcriptional regulator, AbaA-like family n=1 Tax=Streptomyces turgidiscabies (strain Car8) TaxID=698760 RepID=L7F1Z5_STRT8|nr:MULTISPECIES: DUF397 domain-containing protein [Streptomyces]ELP65648.1 transcriptional regulator, AbaA-like family [Streptomyces turgidiscabies Car8]MDX2549172.1 DUF397 domain-containing protein [Streptomyces sp. WI04-05B]MDX2590641.1 DUF397 domain-containing protein [Streptomyces sp. WI04-05A]MDX3499724.1 DUF397 domain-containing protein [Streptomyces turgidiscabies]